MDLSGEGNTFSGNCRSTNGTFTDKDGVGLATDEGLWFYTSPTNQMVSRAPEEQDVMVRGCRDAILTMIHSEPNGAGYQNPGFYK